MTISVESVGRVLVVTLDRPAVRNAIDLNISRILRETMIAFSNDREHWVAVLAANGQDFCAGADMREAADQQRGSREGAVVRGGILRDFQCWKPIIAALHGNVLGAGFELALCADLRIADTTTRFALPEIRLGRMPGGGGTQRLPRSIPTAVALELILTGEALDAERAERIGLVNMVVPAGEDRSAALDLANRIAQHSGPVGMRRAKEAVYRGLSTTLDEGVRIEELLARTLAGTADLNEGTAAFVEHRPPNFEGR